MLRVKAVVSGISVSLKGNVSVTKTRKMLEGHVQVCLEINTVMIITLQGWFYLLSVEWTGPVLVEDIFITNMPIFMDSLLWINKHNSIFQQLSLRRNIETFTLHGIILYKIF